MKVLFGEEHTHYVVSCINIFGINVYRLQKAKTRERIMTFASFSANTETKLIPFASPKGHRH